MFSFDVMAPDLSWRLYLYFPVLFCFGFFWSEKHLLLNKEAPLFRSSHTEGVTDADKAASL